jgi:hypothetical protein
MAYTVARPAIAVDKTRPEWSAFDVRRNVLIALIVLGAGLALAPVAFQMFSRAPKGATMLDEFKPFMTERRLDRFEGYMPEIDDAVRETDTELQPYLAEHAGLDRQQFDARFATFTTFTRQWPAIDTDMTDLLRRVHRNRDNYDAVAALPSFTLFPWFFVIPGVLIAGLAALALLRPQRGRVAIPVLVVLGVGLVVAPFAFQMFQRAPKGGEMMDEFQSIMKRRRVQTIQGYFATMAVGQGAIRIDLIPAAQQAGGLTDEQFAQQFPAIDRLNRDWIGMINDMTPMIGAMSDNVDNYDAIKALPPFPLFPWFFVVPGILTVALAFLARRGSGCPTAREAAARHDDRTHLTPQEDTPIMANHRVSLRTSFLAVTIGATALAVAGSTVAGAAPANAPKPKTLVGTFKLTPGEGSGSAVTGSYFRMVLPGGTADQGPFFPNPDSAATDKTYTLAQPGTDGGLATGKYQPSPNPAFGDQGSSLAGRIIQPSPFTAINFGVSTNATDPQTTTDVPKPKITVKGGKLSGDLKAVDASWNFQDFNQGSPKPDGSKPGLTKAVSGTYDSKTRKYVLEWSSQIVGGAFNDFTGVWHFEGTFEPAKKS